MAQDDVIARLARQIDASKKAERLANPDEVAGLRRQAANELHRICAEFVSAVNGSLAEPALDLSPVNYAPEMFRQPGVNLIRISSQGREMHIVFQAPPKLTSTEKFPVPYILEGEARAYNQQMLEHFEIRSRSLFFCVDQGTAGWRFFDWRNRHSGPVNRELLISLVEPLF